MSTDPKPDNLLSLTHSESSISKCDPDGVNWSCGVNLSVPQTGVVWIIPEKPVRLSGPALDMLRQLSIGRTK